MYIGEILLEISNLLPKRPHIEETSNKQFYENIRQSTESKTSGHVVLIHSKIVLLI